MDVEQRVTAVTHPRGLHTTLPFRRLHNQLALLRPLKTPARVPPLRQSAVALVVE